MYRDLAYHGGIFCLGFVGNWYNNHMAHHLLGTPQQHNPDAFSNNWLWQYMRHNLDTGWFDQRRADWDRIEVPMLHRRQLERHGPAPARQHRGVHARRLETQEAAHPRRHALSPLLQRGRRAGPAALLRLLAEGRKERRDGRAAGEAADPQGRPGQLRLGATSANGRSSARAGRVSTCSRSRVAAKDREAAEGLLVSTAPKSKGAVTYSATGMSKAGVASASWTSTVLPGSLPRLGISFETAPFKEDLEVTGPVGVDAVGVEHDRGHGPLRDHAQHRPRRPGCLGSRPAAAERAGGQGLAARVAP